MEGFDNCKLCTFLLKENELLREQLYQLSVKSSQSDPQNITISSETQTDFQRDLIKMCMTCENYDQTIEMTMVQPSSLQKRLDNSCR